MSGLPQRLAAAAAEPLDPAHQAALDALRRSARRESACGRCRGYGWYPRAGLPRDGEGHAAHVLVCRCDAGERFWALALHDTDGVLTVMELDADGRIAAPDGLFGRFGINDRRMLRAKARESTLSAPGELKHES